MAILRLNRTDATRLLLGARIAAGVGVGLTGIALLLPVAADPPEIAPPPPAAPIDVTIEKSRANSINPSDLGETFATLGPQRQSATPSTGSRTNSNETSPSTTNNNNSQATPTFAWRYLGRIQTSADPWAVLDLGSGQRIVKRGETLDHPQLGPFTLTQIEEQSVTLAGVSEDRTLDRAPRQANALGSFSAPAPTTNRVTNRAQPFNAPRRTPENVNANIDERMERQREELLKLREQRLRARQREAENEGSN